MKTDGRHAHRSEGRTDAAAVDERSVVLFVDAEVERAVRAGRTVERAVPGVAVEHVEPAAGVDAACDDGVVCVVTAWRRSVEDDSGAGSDGDDSDGDDDDDDDGDSVSFLAALRARRPSVPVVLFTDSGLSAVAEAVAAYDVADVRPRTPPDAADELLARSVASLTGDGEAAHAGAGDGLRTYGYRQLVEQNIVGIYAIEDRVFRYVNPRTAEIFGTTREAMEGRPVLSFVAPEDHHRVRRRLEARERADREETHYVFTGVRADGRRIEVEASGGRVGGDDVAIAGVLVDVTDRKRREREVRHLSRAVEHAALAVYVTDSEETITYVNPAFERVTGHAAADVVGETPQVLNSGRMDDAYYDEMYATINEGRVWRDDIVDRRASGELYHARQTIAPIVADGRIEGFVAIQEDVTGDRIRQQVLQVLHRVLRHNLRNELNVIAGHAGVLADQSAAPGDESRVASAQAILRATEELQHLSDRATEAESALETETTERRAIDLVALLRRQWGRLEGGGVGSMVVEGASVAEVSADATLAIAVRELLRAATTPGGDDAAGDPERPDGEPATVATVRRCDDEVELRLGIDETTASEWDPVRTGVETPLDHATGLDMWLVEWVVTRLGGDLRLTDEAAASTLTVRLPAASVESPARRGRRDA